MLLAAVPVDEIPGEEILQIFDQRFFHVDLASGEKTYLYRLFRPHNTDPSKKYPLIVWLHGYGDVEFEKIGFGHLKHTGAIFKSVEQAKSLDFYFLAVQCPIDQPGFFRQWPSNSTSDGIAVEPPEPGEIVVRLIDELIEEALIDPGRVTLVGISGAGSACLEMAVRYPDKYAGIAILGSPGYDLARVSLLRNTPVWAFHAKEDPNVPVSGIETTIGTIESVGGEAELTLIESNYHNCWAVAFRDYALLDWLLSQNRGSLFARSPGSVPWTWQRLLVKFLLSCLVVIAIFNALRRRSRRRLATSDIRDSIEYGHAPEASGTET